MNSEYPKVKVACIFDEFTFHSFSAVFELCQITPSDYETELAEFRPAFLWVESAWRGKDDTWFNKLINDTTELVKILELCRSLGIPTLFWNKEDPLYFDSFTQRSPVAQLFDAVCTTELDMLPKYRHLLRHTNVYWLPFTVNVQQHHPLQSGTRNNGFCFAGSYYPQFPKRCMDFEQMIEALQLCGIPGDIYDRNFADRSSPHQFPQRYHAQIKGSLPYSEIEKAYKGYRYGVSMNTVVSGQTMFARRALELIASNTVVLSNYCRAFRLLFGPKGSIMIQTGGGPNLDFKDPSTELRDRALMLYKCLEDYSVVTWAPKVLSYVGIPQQKPSIPAKVLVLGIAADSTEAERVQNMLEAQVFRDYQLVWSEDFHFDLVHDYKWICIFDGSCWYSPVYLKHMILISSVYPDTIISKPDDKHALWQKVQTDFAYVSKLNNKAWLSPIGLFSDNLLHSGDELSQQCLGNILEIEPFDYFSDYHVVEKDLELINFLTLSDHDIGLSIEKLEQIAKHYNKTPSILYSQNVPAILEIADSLTATPYIKAVLERENQILELHSVLQHGKHSYINMETLLDVSDFAMRRFSMIYLTEQSSTTLLDIHFLDDQKRLIRRQLFCSGESIDEYIPERSRYILVGFRCRGPGVTRVLRLQFGRRVEIPSMLLPIAKHLLQCNEEQLPQLLASSHSDTELFVLSEDIDFRYEFREGLDITYGGEKVLAALKQGRLEYGFND